MSICIPEATIGKTVDAIIYGADGMVIGFDDGTFMTIRAENDSGDPCGLVVDENAKSVLYLLSPREALRGRFITKAVYDKMIAEEKAKAEEHLKRDLSRAKSEAERLQRLIEKNAA